MNRLPLHCQLTDAVWLVETADEDKTNWVKTRKNCLVGGVNKLV